MAPFIDFLEGTGAPVERLLGQARIPGPLLQEPEALMPVWAAYRFAELAARQERLQDIGIIVGQRASSFDLGAYGATLRQTATVLEYLRVGVRLIGEHSSGTRMWLSSDDTSIRVNQHVVGHPGLGRCIADLYTLSLTINTLRRFVGAGWHPGEVRLLAGDERLLGDSDIFGDAELIVGQRYTSFTVPRRLVLLPVSPPSAGVAADGGNGTTAGRPMPTDFKTSAEELVLGLLGDGYPGIEAAAEAAGMSSRTMQRRLAEAGVTYKGLVSASRLRLARAWLAETDLPVSEIAARLGYNEASNFTRAFRRETGLSPATYRRGLSTG
jgi:AraC-like DNA-binding protein